MSIALHNRITELKQRVATLERQVQALLAPKAVEVTTGNIVDSRPRLKLPVKEQPHG